MPKVSVHIPCYNGEKYIAEALQSVLDQTFHDFEIIVVNDGSTDRTEDIIKGFCDERIKYYYQENIGLARTRNRQLELSNGELIAFLDQDDLWLPRKLEKQIPLFEKNPDVGLVSSDTIFFDITGKEQQIYKKQKPPRGRVFRQLLTRNFLGLVSVVIRRNVLDNLSESFDNRFTASSDIDLFLRICHDYEFDYVDEPLAKWRMHLESWTFARKEVFPKERQQILDKFRVIYPDFENEFKDEVYLMEGKIQYGYAMLDWEQGNNVSVRKRLGPYMKFSRKCFLAYVFSFFPYKVYIHMVKLYRKLNGRFI